MTLEEIYHGCVKKMKISRRVLEQDGTPRKEDKYVSISVKPGWKSGTKVTFQKEGDQTKGRIPADIVFIIRDKPHPLFKREGGDLRYTARLTLKQVNMYTKKLPSNIITFYEKFTFNNTVVSAFDLSVLFSLCDDILLFLASGSVCTCVSCCILHV